MPQRSKVNRTHVLSAIEEYERVGQDEFLETYGFGPSRGYELVHGRRSYDSNAVLGVAYRYATGAAARAEEFHGGANGAAKVLRALGFHVTEPGGS
jgi:hypothetical protein